MTEQGQRQCSCFIDQGNCCEADIVVFSTAEGRSSRSQPHTCKPGAACTAASTAAAADRMP